MLAGGARLAGDLPVRWVEVAPRARLAGAVGAVVPGEALALGEAVVGRVQRVAAAELRRVRALEDGALEGVAVALVRGAVEGHEGGERRSICPGRAREPQAGSRRY